MKKLLLSLILDVLAVCYAQAAEPVKGIMCTYAGSETTYAFCETPIVKYQTEDGVQYAKLYVSGSDNCVCSFALEGGKQLVITYGQFVPTSVGEVGSDNVTITDKDGMKYIQGGRLIIIKSGKKYTIEGKEINQK